MKRPQKAGGLWIAQRHGQDWRDEAVLAAVEWLVQLVTQTDWSARSDAVEERFQSAKARWADADRVPLFLASDTIAWYVHQARRYADPSMRTDFFLPEGYRIAPLFRRLGQLLPVLREVTGVEERAARIMIENTSQPDDGIFELLVAGAYAVRGWDKVAFVPEAPGIEKRHDLLVERSRSSWAIECKRAGRHGYGVEERAAGERMASRAHALSREAGRPLLVLSSFGEELYLLGDDYLANKVASFLQGTAPLEWADEGGKGVVLNADLRALHSVMAHDDIYFGSSRMVQLLLGEYDPVMDFTVEGNWTPAKGRPLHATSVGHVSLVVWRSTAEEAARRKSMHFRGLVARASEQLPGDRPAAIHVGYEAVGGNSEDSRRHELNAREMASFNPHETGLRVVYGNYFRNELVTARNESAAVSETLAWYPVGRRKLLEPLPRHLLFGDEQGADGSHL